MCGVAAGPAARNDLAWCTIDLVGPAALSRRHTAAANRSSSPMSPIGWQGSSRHRGRTCRVTASADARTPLDMGEPVVIAVYKGTRTFLCRVSHASDA